MHRLRALDPRLADALLAAGLLVAGQLELASGAAGQWTPVKEATLPLATLPLAVRRRYPLAALAPVLAALALQTANGAAQNGSVVMLAALLLASYSAAAHSGRAGAVLALLAGEAAVLAAIAVGPRHTGGDLAFGSLVIALPWIAGRAMRGRVLAADLLRAEQDERAQAAVAAERQRIARELHDVVAHAVSVMVVQAQGASRVLDTRPEQAREALATIETTGREALDEMHRLVGILRTGPDDLAPQGSLRHLDDLVERMRAAGVDARACVEGQPRPLAPGLDLAAYRIVQEALTNTLKHAGRVPASIVVRYLPGAVEIEVVDEGRTGRRSSPAPSRHGLVGMRERAALYGGRVEAGPRPAGGFAVRAWLPAP